MSDRKTSSILQRVPVILAVTAASYGLQLPPHVGRPGQAGATASTTRVGTGDLPRQAALPAATATRRNA
jgi:hypothetical protein